MNKVFIILILALMILPLGSAVDTYKKGSTINIITPCELEGGGICDPSTTNCNISISLPNGTYIIDSLAMTNRSNGDFNFTLKNPQSAYVGRYDRKVTCIDRGYNGTLPDYFEVTPTGSKPDTAQGIIYFGVTFIVFISLLLMILGAVYTDKKYLKLGLSLLSYLLFNWLIFVLWKLSENYLGMAGLGSMLRVFWIVTTVGIFPVFILAFLIVLKEIKDDQFTQNLIKRGLPHR